MRYLFPVLVLLSCPAFAQFVQRTPLSAPEAVNILANRAAYQRFDRENGIYYYDSLPISFNSVYGGSGGEIVLQPFISVVNYTGETQFHLWVTYHPPLSPSGDTFFIRPKYLSFQTMRNRVTLPLMYYYPAASVPAGTMLPNLAPGTPSPLGETAYAVLSAEDISGLAAIALDGINNTPVESWEPSVVELFRQNTSGRKTDPNESPGPKRNVEDYLEFQRSIGSTNTAYRTFNWGEFDPVLPPMAEQRAVSLVLYGEKSSQSITTVQENLVPFLEMMDLYQALSNRTIAMP